MSVERKCRKCDAALVVGENWYRSSVKKRNYMCRACIAEKNREHHSRYYAKNKERVAEAGRKWLAENRERKAVHSMIYGARKRAAKHGLPFDLDGRQDELEGIILHGGCHYTGLPFNLDGGQTWDSPSLDRIAPELGYVWSNVRVVLWGVNAFKGITTLEKMCFIAEHLLEWQAVKAARAVGSVLVSNQQASTEE